MATGGKTALQDSGQIGTVPGLIEAFERCLHTDISSVESKPPPEVIPILKPVNNRSTIVDRGLTILTHNNQIDPLRKEFSVVVSTNNGYYAILLCDIASTGTEIGLQILSLESRARSLLFECNSPSEFLEEFNTHIARSHYRIDFLTATAVMADPSRRLIRVSGAGYRPVVYRPWPRKRWRYLESNGIPLGIRDGVKYPETTLRLQSGDKLVSLSENYLRLNEHNPENRLLDHILDVLDSQAVNAAPSEIIESLDYAEMNGKQCGNSTAVLLQF